MKNTFTINFIKHPTKEMFRVETVPNDMEDFIHRFLAHNGKGSMSIEHPIRWYSVVNKEVLIRELELETAE